MPLRCAEWAGLAVASSAALGGLCTYYYLSTRAQLAELRRLIERDSARGIARLADELQDGYQQLSAAQAGLERLAVSVAEHSGRIVASSTEGA